MGEKDVPVILPKFRLPHKFRDLLHATNLRHGTDGFTSPPKEGVLRIFFALKIRRLRPGLNPRTWVLKASTLTLDHRSRYIYIYIYTYVCKVFKTSLCTGRLQYSISCAETSASLSKNVESKKFYVHIQGDQKVSADLTITVEYIVSTQNSLSPCIYIHIHIFKISGPYTYCVILCNGTCSFYFTARGPYN